MTSFLATIDFRLIRLGLQGFWVVVTCAAASATSIYAQPEPNPPLASQPLFDNDETLELVISTDIRALLRDRGEDPSYREASLLHVQGKDTTVLPIEVRVRGNFRRNPTNCDFPPLRLKFDPETTDGTLFAGQDKLKMVTHCQTGRSVYEQYVLQEYLAYRVYTLLTERSFRVRLANITYLDSTGKRKPLESIAFLLEDEQAMARRNGAINLDRQKVLLPWTESLHATLLPVYQYMIGNTDWEVPVLHNIRLLAIGGVSQPVAVPYDLDVSGVVDAEYAVPLPMLGLRSVRERMYRGHCQPAERFASVVASFNEKKDAIYALYENNPLLNERQLRKTLSYYDDFYKQINDERSLRIAFVQTCRKELGPSPASPQSVSNN